MDKLNDFVENFDSLCNELYTYLMPLSCDVNDGICVDFFERNIKAFNPHIWFQNGKKPIYSMLTLGQRAKVMLNEKKLRRFHKYCIESFKFMTDSLELINDYYKVYDFSKHEKEDTLLNIFNEHSSHISYIYINDDVKNDSQFLKAYLGSINTIFDVFLEHINCLVNVETNNMEKSDAEVEDINLYRLNKNKIEVIINSIDSTDGYKYVFKTEPEFLFFVDLLAKYFSNNSYQLPTSQIMLNKSTKTRFAKVLREIHRDLSESKLISDSSFFNIIRTLNHFAVYEKDDDLYRVLIK